MTSRARFFELSALAISFLALSAYLFKNVVDLAVNTLFRDQWFVYFDIVDGPLWNVFGYQSNVHRLGLGGVATAIIARVTAWDVRAESYFSAALLVLAAFLALWLKLRVTGHL